MLRQFKEWQAIAIIKDTQREKAPTENSSAYAKYEYGRLSSWFISSRFCNRPISSRAVGFGRGS